MTRVVRPREGELVTAADRARRLAALDGAHMAPLLALQERIANRFGPTPYPDPFDGGTAARLLLLLETPGPGLAAPRFVSRDNPTGTARNIRRFSDAAGLPRVDTVIWNAVPWVIHAPGARNRAPRTAEIAAGLALVPDLLACLPHLGVVVLAGRVAGLAAPVVRAHGCGATILRIPHPSPVHVNTAPAIAAGIVRVLGEAAAILTRTERVTPRS